MITFWPNFQKESRKERHLQKKKRNEYSSVFKQKFFIWRRGVVHINLVQNFWGTTLSPAQNFSDP